MIKYLIIIVLLIVSINGYSLDRIVSKILNDGNYLWLATQNGLVKLNKETEEKTIYNEQNSGIPSNYVSNFAKDGDGKLWVTTSQGGFGVLDRDSWIVYNRDNIGISNRCDAIIVGNENIKWIGARNYLCRFDGVSTQSWTTYAAMASSDFIISDLKFDKTGTLYLAGDSKLLGLAKWSFAKFADDTIITYPEIETIVNNIEIDEANNIWFGQANKGLYMYDGETFINYNTSNSGLPSDYITFVELDASGDLWMNCDKDLVKFDGTTFTNYGSPFPEGSTEIIMCLESDSEGNIWFGTRSSDLYKFSNGQFVHIAVSEQENGMGKANVNSLVVSIQYYDLLGKPVVQPQRGHIYIVKEMRQSGKMETKKVVVP